MSNTLDITNFKQKGQDLHDAIVREVKPLATSKLMTPIPDRIRMSEAQFDDLGKLSHVETFYHTEDRLYTTPYNVMEVVVNKANKLSFIETMALDDKAFNEWEGSVGL
jgi:hypothetical protein